MHLALRAKGLTLTNGNAVLFPHMATGLAGGVMWQGELAPSISVLWKDLRGGQRDQRGGEMGRWGERGGERGRRGGERGRRGGERGRRGGRWYRYADAQVGTDG